MRRELAIIFSAAACLVLAGCSQSDNAAKEQAAIPAKDQQAPDVFRVDFDTSKGPVVVEIHRDWAPNGVDHFYTLVKTGYYDGTRFYRVLRDFVAQFGIAADPGTNALWSNASIPDDRVRQSNVRGTLTYAATSMPNSRTTQLFFNLRNNSPLDAKGFAPIGKVVSGMDAVDSFYNSYGETSPSGQGPDPTKMEQQGNSYLDDHFPRLDYIKKAAIQ
jgi:cyclophilin family peptidyl-prolyl cis-trans isomerase